MVEEVHELLGFIAIACLSAVAILGGAIFYYRNVKAFLPAQRKSLVTAHRYLSLGFLLCVLLHYLTADKSHPLQLAGASAMAVVFLLGASLHFWKKVYRPLVFSKVAVLVVAAPVLLVGHSLVEEPEHREEHSHLAAPLPTGGAADGLGAPLRRNGHLPITR